MKENTFVHRLLRRALSLCLSLALTVSLCPGAGRPTDLQRQ